MTGPYREGEEKTREPLTRDRVVYTLHPWSAVVLIIMQVLVLTIASFITHDALVPHPREKEVIRYCPRPHETPQQHAATLRRDIAVCTRACGWNGEGKTHFVAVQHCEWQAGGVRTCACQCDAATNNQSITEQR